MSKTQTLCLIYNKTSILLGMKKRGFGAGRWNGFGGKVNEGESIEEAALREVEEEIGVKPQRLKKRGLLKFYFEHDPVPIQVHVFSTAAFTGDAHESEEMKPQWFAHGAIPYDQMWIDDKHWLPLVLAGKDIEATFHFGKDDTLQKYKVEERTTETGRDKEKK